MVQQNKLAKEQAGKKCLWLVPYLRRTCLYRQAYSYLLTGHLRIQQQRILLRRKTRFIWDYEKCQHYYKSIRTLSAHLLDLG